MIATFSIHKPIANGKHRGGSGPEPNSSVYRVALRHSIALSIAPPRFRFLGYKTPLGPAWMNSPNAARHCHETGAKAALSAAGTAPEHQQLNFASCSCARLVSQSRHGHASRPRHHSLFCGNRCESVKILLVPRSNRAIHSWVARWNEDAWTTYLTNPGVLTSEKDPLSAQDSFRLLCGLRRCPKKGRTLGTARGEAGSSVMLELCTNAPLLQSIRLLSLARIAWCRCDVQEPVSLSHPNPSGRSAGGQNARQFLQE